MAGTGYPDIHLGRLELASYILITVVQLLRLERQNLEVML